MTEQVTREQVRETYAAAARAVARGGGNDEALRAEHAEQPTPLPGLETSASCCSGEPVEISEVFGARLYDADMQGELPVQAVAASLGCGNPTAITDLHPGERVLDLGSGGGIDVLGSSGGCVAGALSRQEYLDGLAAAGFADASVEFTHEVADGIHGAIVRATKPR